MKAIRKEDLKTLSLVNNKGSELEVLNFGAAVLSFKIKDKSGEIINVVVSPRAEDFVTSAYKEHNKCFGASVGRYAGRISKGQFKLDETTYKLFEQDDVHLHGGNYGFQYKIWEIVEETSAPNPSVKLSYFSKDGEESYPGNLEVEVKYILTENNELLIEYSAKTDKKTVVNLTNHTYFNLNGGGSISDHFLKISAEKILEVDKNLLPTGNLTKLKKNPKNFSESKLIGNRNLDDTFVLKSEKDQVAARLFAPLTGIKMEVRTNQKALVTYAPENLPEDLNYHTEIAEQYPSLCLEAQNFPDAPNFRNFPKAVLKPGEQYYNSISYKFSVSGY
ncbi:galactose mutarotase [Salegentibacter sp. JZCK2]|uniref:aldose epimerase family protein n=1 Tax=Salegentibacter tibetensis TaxID=2873600 RepID=UPI001CC9812E|nr:aldose epimerase family protein [Salegentibacter tibetensis]MBZ9730020.1 galactose mutarotase [Salegentibacter tibetensis]